MSYLLFVTSFIWMVLDGEFSVGLLDLLEAGIFRYADNLIELGRVDVLSRSLSSWEPSRESTIIVIECISEWKSTASAKEHFKLNSKIYYSEAEGS